MTSHTKVSAVFLFPWKLIWQVTWGQTPICGHVRKRHSKSFGDPQSKQPNRISPTITGHTAANWHSAGKLLTGKLSHTAHVHLHTALRLLGPRILLLYIFHSYILLSHSFLSTVLACPLAKVWNQGRLLSGWSK